MLGGTAASLVLVMVFTFLYALVEVLAGARREIEKVSIPRTQPKVRSCITDKFWLYVSVLALANLAGTLLAWHQLPRWFPGFFDTLGNRSFFIYAVVGVFLFQALVTNTNVWIFSKGAMAFKEWTSLIRTPAIAAAIEKDSERDRDRLQQTAEALTDLLSDTELNTRIKELAGEEEANKLEADAQDADDPKKYKLLWLARRYPTEAKSILKAKREPP